jgi:cutinase
VHINPWAMALLMLAVTMSLANSPPARGQVCPRVEVSFARGTDEPPGIGETGQNFVNALGRRIGPVGVYAVDYPADHNFTGSTIAGVSDLGHHVQYMVNICPGTRLVFGGYSQGAAVVGFVTSAVPPAGVDIGDLRVMDPVIANHVAAVVLFGTPSDQFMGLLGEPSLVIGPLYADKTTQLCTDNDPVCSGAGLGGDWAAHNDYGGTPVDDGATFAAWRL